jgi:hypothetical protein
MTSEASDILLLDTNEFIGHHHDIRSQRNRKQMEHIDHDVVRTESKAPGLDA